VRARALAALADVGLAEKAEQPVREISHGEQRQLELAIALARRRACSCLDEPAAGLSPDETKKLVALVRALKGRYTIVLIEHKMDIIMSVSDRISSCHFGSLIAQGTPAEIQRNPEVRRAYLGGSGGMILEIKGIDSFYGARPYPSRPLARRREGEVVALLGRNGAGKTTTLRSVTASPRRSRAKSATRAGTSPAWLPTRSPAWALPSSLRRAASSPT